MDWIILAIIYLVSAIAWYFAIRYQFTHEFKNISPTWFEIIITFVPFVNTLWSILWWAIIAEKIIERNINYKKRNLAAKFFKIKK